MARNDALANGHTVINAKIYQFSVILYLCNRKTYCRPLFLELHAAPALKLFKDRGRAHAHHAKICT